MSFRTTFQGFEYRIWAKWRWNVLRKRNLKCVSAFQGCAYWTMKVACLFKIGRVFSNHLSRAWVHYLGQVTLKSTSRERRYNKSFVPISAWRAKIAQFQAPLLNEEEERTWVLTFGQICTFELYKSKWFKVIVQNCPNASTHVCPSASLSRGAWNCAIQHLREMFTMMGLPKQPTSRTFCIRESMATLTESKANLQVRVLRNESILDEFVKKLYSCIEFIIRDCIFVRVANHTHSWYGLFDMKQYQAFIPRVTQRVA